MVIYKVLIIGLGSMGRRRIRCLNSIGEFEIHGFDTNKRRLKNVCSEFKLEEMNDLEKIKIKSFDFFIISTSPESHHIYIDFALELCIPSFVEASVLDKNHDLFLKKIIKNNTPIVPSCTLQFHPAISFIKSMILKNELGKMLTMSYNSGQYLPDWHLYEEVKDFYVSKKETGGAREIVPFELTWITDLFGFPENILGIIKKTTIIKGAENIDDTYSSILEYENSIINLNVDVISRKATRKLIMNFEYGQINWDWEFDSVQVFNSKTNDISSFDYKVESQKGYIKNISEQMYIDEIDLFIKHIFRQEYYPNNFEKDMKVLRLLYLIEKSNELGSKLSVIDK